MWGESSGNCENHCDCSGLITENFRINSGNNATKRKQEEAFSTNYKLKMNPHSLDFNKLSPHSPIITPKRRVLGELQNSPHTALFRPKQSPQIERLKTPIERKSPLLDRNSLSPLTSRSDRYSKKSSTKISRIFEERTRFKMSNKENSPALANGTFASETFVKLDVEEETRDCQFSRDGFQSSFSSSVTNWSMTKLDFTDALQTKTFEITEAKKETEDLFVPQKEMETDLDPDTEMLHDLEEEFEADNFDQCTKYEIISTDSPNIISRGRNSTSIKINAKDFEFGALLSDSEASTSFNKPTTATRMLKFEDENFEFTSPIVKRTSSMSVKKSLKFSETPPKHPLRHERSDSSIGSMSSMSSFPSPASSKVRLFTSESTTSMESGFISELEEPFLDLEEASNSPKMANFSDLLSGKIKMDVGKENSLQIRRPALQRSVSYNPESKARVSLFSILESPKERTQKRERYEVYRAKKKRKANCESPESDKEGRIVRPVLQRALSENNASIMTALARSALDPDLTGDFSARCALPLVPGDHPDLKCISCDTLAALLQGEYADTISDYQIIDCRFPYEYEGGHIMGALNYHTQEHIAALMDAPLPPVGDKRSILVFHCELSLQRGPSLARYLRARDRRRHRSHYPTLRYPELYLLHAGYRQFYREHAALCRPRGYVAMKPHHA